MTIPQPLCQFFHFLARLTTGNLPMAGLQGIACNMPHGLAYRHVGASHCGVRDCTSSPQACRMAPCTGARASLNRVPSGAIAASDTSRGWNWERRVNKARGRACAQPAEQDEAWTSWKMPDDVPNLAELYDNGEAVPADRNSDGEQATLAQILRPDTVRYPFPCPSLFTLSPPLCFRVCVGSGQQCKAPPPLHTLWEGGSGG